MKIWVNGEERDSESLTLAALCEELDLGEVPVATALNGVFVAKAARTETRLIEGDRIEVLSPRQGG